MCVASDADVPMSISIVENLSHTQGYHVSSTEEKPSEAGPPEVVEVDGGDDAPMPQSDAHVILSDGSCEHEEAECSLPAESVRSELASPDLQTGEDSPAVLLHSREAKMLKRRRVVS